MGNKLEKANKNSNSNSNSNTNSPQKNPKLSEAQLRQKDVLYSEEKLFENYESKIKQ